SVVRFTVEAARSAEANNEDEDITAEGTALYQAVPTMLSCRLALTGSLVSKRVVQLSSLQAPIGYISVAFMYVVGASTLLTEIPGPAKRALDQFQRLVYRLLGAKGGYLVEGEAGLVLAAFSSPVAAVEWALDCVAGLKKLAWEPELLSHWLCEEVLSVGLRSDGMVELDDEELAEGKEAGGDGGSGDGAVTKGVGGGGDGGDGGAASGAGGDGDGAGASAGAGAGAGASDAAAAGDTGGGGAAGGGEGDGGGREGRRSLSKSASGPGRSLRRGLSRMPSMARLGAMATTRRVLERGLRIKVGLDAGMAAHSLNEASGRLTYRGKVMNRASRVAGKAAAGQVVCTDACWRGCLEGASAAAAANDNGVDECGSGALDSSDGADETASSESDSIGGLVGISLGKVALKGVSAPVELIQCMRGK
ncbi:hypothetical protein VaNZ11_009154, partial [Volvox africanus]